MCRSLKSELLRARLGFRIGHAGENHEDADIQGKSECAGGDADRGNLAHDSMARTVLAFLQVTCSGLSKRRKYGPTPNSKCSAQNL